MRSDTAFRQANKAAAPLVGLGGGAMALGGVLALLVPRPTAAICLLLGAVAAAALCIAGGIKGIRACR